MKQILITGATGYIGRRLKDKLLQRSDLAIRILVRNKNKVRASVLHQVDVVEGDTFHRVALLQALQGVDVAFYLIHSMGSGQDFAARDRQSAEHFRQACIEAGVPRLVYLGGLGEKQSASKHLLSRIETGEILSASPNQLQTIWLRAGIIIGAGSASFEIIHNLVQKLPVMITPKWVCTRTQPIAVDDVLAYLAATIDAPIKGNLVVDIGTESMSFKEMMRRAAKVLGLRRLLLPVPILSPRLSSFWLILLTPIPFPMAAALVEGLKSETLVLNDHAARYFPAITPMPFEQAVRTAMDEMERNQVLSRWCDSSADVSCDIRDHDDIHTAVLRDQRRLPLHNIAPPAVYASIISIGGKDGWFTYHFLWQIRGWIDKLLGGYGLNRSRRQHGDLRPGDALDFWKVADVKPNKRLLLWSQMKLPGKAWLEFDIQNDALVQTAHFLPRGVLGRLYWYAVLPFHGLVFRNLAQQILKRAARIT